METKFKIFLIAYSKNPLEMQFDILEIALLTN